MKQLKIGDILIDSIVERAGPWRPPEAIFPAYHAEPGLRHLKELGPAHYEATTNRLSMTYQSYLIRTPRRTILVDTCTGDDKGYPPPLDFPKRAWMDGLLALGLGPEDIDIVFCTHLHIEHCGWNTTLRNGRWVPTFPRATYVFHRGEYEYWQARTARGERPPGAVWTINCEPVVAAGQGLLVGEDHVLDEGVTLTLTPGHTPWHCCVDIASGGQRAGLAGDLMHHALQLREPEWSTVYCADAAQAARSRRDYLTKAAEQQTVLLPVHFPIPSAGRVAVDGTRFRWLPLGSA